MRVLAVIDALQGLGRDLFPGGSNMQFRSISAPSATSAPLSTPPPANVSVTQQSPDRCQATGPPTNVDLNG